MGLLTIGFDCAQPDKPKLLILINNYLIAIILFEINPNPIILTNVSLSLSSLLKTGFVEDFVSGITLL